MKSDIHPTYYPSAKVKCACGATFVVGSTKETIEVEVCSACHPFYVGDESKKVVAGRLEKFKERQHKAAAKKEEATKRGPKAARKPKVEKEK